MTGGGGSATAHAGPLTWRHAVFICGMLATGTLNIVVKKVAYDTTSRGKDGVVKPFHKPWTLTLVMFSGELLCLLYFLLKVRCSRASTRTKSLPSSSSSGVPLLDHVEGAVGEEQGADVGTGGADVVSQVEIPKAGSWFICLLPAACDIGGTTISGIGLVFTTPSVYQMLRGSIIVFAALLSLVVLKRKLHAFHWVGMFVTVVGISLVGMSSFFSDRSVHAASTSGSKVMLGNVLVIVAQLMASVQYVVEEKFLKGRQLPAEFVVGAEGMFGVGMMVAVMLPLVALLPGTDGDGVHENALESVTMLSNNHRLLAIVLMYWVSIAFYNFSGLSVAKHLSAVHRTLVDACTTTLIWSVDILIYYVAGDEAFGEKWSNDSFLQLGGFVLIVVGTSLYYKAWRPSCFWYPSEDAVAA